MGESANEPKQSSKPTLVPPQAFATRLALIEEHLSQQDERLDAVAEKLDTILEGINGTPQRIGMAGDIRNLTKWREELETVDGRHVPLQAQIKELSDWQHNVSRTILFIGTPATGAIVVGVLVFIWALLTHQLHIGP